MSCSIRFSTWGACQPGASVPGRYNRNTLSQLALDLPPGENSAVGAIGPMLAIDHGEVNEESNGPVEVCIPVNPAPDQGIQAATRIEPAHREAHTRIKKSQVAFPQILSAYEAVEQWIGANNEACSASPREIYFADFMAAGPDDEVCDIAFPLA